MTPTSDRVASWRRWSGYGVVALLAVALIAISSNRPNPTGAPVAISTGSVPMVSTFPSAVSTIPPTGAPTPTGETALTATASAGVADVVGAVVDEALVAWGEFAISGELDLVRQWFWQDGPQWMNLEAEARGIKARTDVGPSYSVSIEDKVLETTETSVSVVGTVWFERSGERAQQFEWTIVLIHRDGEWRIWAVEPSR